MGVDLTVAIGDHEQSKWWLCYDRLKFDRAYKLQGLIGPGRGPGHVVVPMPIPRGIKVTWYEDGGCQDIVQDSYGTPLGYLLADDWKTVLAAAKKSIPDLSRRNRAVLKFLTKAPCWTVLYWH